MKIGVCILLFVQIALLSLGVWLVKENTNPFVFCSGIFIIIGNIIFGSINIKTLIS